MAKGKASAIVWLVAVVVIWWLCTDQPIKKPSGTVTMGDDWEATFNPESGNWNPAYQKGGSDDGR